MANTVVTAPLVIAYAEDGSAHHLYKGAVLDDRFGSDEVKRLVKEGFAEAEKTAKPKASGKSSDEAPPKNASTEDWQNYAKSKGATDVDLKDGEGNDLSRDDLAAKFGV